MQATEKGDRRDDREDSIEWLVCWLMRKKNRIKINVVVIQAEKKTLSRCDSAMRCRWVHNVYVNLRQY